MPKQTENHESAWDPEVGGQQACSLATSQQLLKLSDYNCDSEIVWLWTHSFEPCLRSRWTRLRSCPMFWGRFSAFSTVPVDSWESLGRPGGWGGLCFWPLLPSSCLGEGVHVHHTLPPTVVLSAVPSAWRSQVWKTTFLLSKATPVWGSWVSQGLGAHAEQEPPEMYLFRITVWKSHQPFLPSRLSPWPASQPPASYHLPYLPFVCRPFLLPSLPQSSP